MDFKKYVKIFIAEVIFLMVTTVGLIIAVDPFFHYHKPLENVYYKLTGGYERYQNDGILKNFDYNAVITGTSMTENFKASEAEALFDGNPIKVPFSGGSFNEINDNLAKAYKYGHRVDYVIRSLDTTHLNEDQNSMRNDLGVYPEYLYNDDFWDDTYYIFNKDTVKLCLQNLKETYKQKQGGHTDFDEYANWNDNFEFGAKAVKVKHTYPPNAEKIKILTAKDIDTISKNVEKNVVALAKAHPETTFYYFFPPYSIAYWRDIWQREEIDARIAAEKLAIELILQCPNIKLYSFNLMTDMITDLDNYKDPAHYGEWINSKILVWMKNDEGLLTEENYQEYLKKEYEFYNNYDYDSVFKNL